MRMAINKLQAIADSNLYDLFLTAVKEEEVGNKFWSSRDYKEFITAIQKSATCLVQALLITKGIISEIDKQPISDVAGMLKKSNDLSSSVRTSILNILSLDKEAAINEKSVEKMKTAYLNYSDCLVNARKEIVSELGYTNKIWRNIKQLTETREGIKKLSMIVLPIFFLISIPLAIFYKLEPISDVDYSGQIYWKEKPKVPFTSYNSKHLPVIADNQFREYNVELASPVNIFLLRLDPVNQSGLTDVEIESVQLFNEENVLLRELRLDKSMYWSCENCSNIDTNTNTLRMRPINNDPYLTSTPINQTGVKKIIIKMRAVSKKTFWEWVLGIDTSMEF